ncbi:MAG: flagellar filament capping protein FliD [Granulosicoccus sp.]
MITAAGVGSGIDIESILSQLMTLEQQPITALEEKRKGLDVELSAFGSVKSALNELATNARTMGDASKFGPFVANTSDEAVFTAEATGGGAGESHEIEVLALAQGHRVASQAYASTDASVSTGNWSFSSGENSFDIDIGAGNSTLLDLRDAINDSVDNTSVVASILNVDGGSRLILTAKESGTANAITLGGSATGTGIGFADITPASDAELIVDGFAVTGSSNSVSDVMSGVTLSLTGVGKAEVNTSRDTESLRTSLDEFVTNYNGLRDTLTTLAETELNGDRMPRNIEAKVRNLFSAPIELANGDSMSPLSLGFTFDRYGTLSIDETKLNDAQKNGLENFINAFAEKDTGLANKLEGVLDQYTQAGGIIAGRNDGIDNRRQSLDTQIERLEYKLGRTEERYRRQFTVMDQVVSQLQASGSYLQNRLSY